MTRHLEGWKLAGVCAAHPDPDLWFADDPAHLQAAKGLCGGCPVRGVCLDAAMARGEGLGVWGGLDPAERRRLAVDLGLRRPSVHGASQHGQRSTYNAGCHCGPCSAANAAYKAAWQLRRPVTARPTLVVAVLERPTGRGLHRAWPGQLYIGGVAA